MKSRNQQKRFSTWYDGFIYEKLVSPESSRLRAFLTIFVKKGSTVLDVGCGVGSLVFELSKKCQHVVGVDLSERMILRANKIKSKSQITNVEFIKADATKLNQVISRHFDCMTIALCLHEMSPQTRRDIMTNCLLSSNTIIIADFSSPFPRGKAGTFLRMQEAFAGRRHFHNFKNWIGAGGIDGFIKEMGLNAHKLVQWENGAGKVAIIRVVDVKGRNKEIVQEP